MTALLLKKMLLPVTDLLDEHVPELTRLDSITGDGDHGVSVGKISEVIRSAIGGLEGQESMTEVLDDLSWDIMNINGGSAGPLYGAFFEGMATGAGQTAETEEELVRNILISAYENFDDVSGAKVGEKTMMDAIKPATEALQAEDDFESALYKMGLAATEGADKTSDMVAKFGRAKTLKEKSIGHKDPGAVSFSLVYRGIAKGLMNN
jgi:dihydroxyacetone kinase-like protein